MQNSRKTFKNALKLICSKIFFIHLFPGRLSMAAPGNRKQLVNIIKFIESFINEFEGKRKSHRSCWFCQISVDFTVFCKKKLTNLS